MKAHRIIVRGGVQGVFYRIEAKENAEKLGIKGYAKNLDDGTVEIIAVGERGNVEDFIRRCWEGPDIARVEAVDVTEIETDEEFEDFDVKY